MRVVVAHARAGTLELLRYPAYSLSTLLFPTLLFLLFAPRSMQEGQTAELALVGFAAMAVLAVAFFQFGVGIAAERNSPWEAYVRTLPVTMRARLAARVLSALLFAVCSCTLVVVVAIVVTPASLSATQLALLASMLLAGAIPLCLLGIALGYLVPPRAALPVANILFLPVSFLGGLWGGPQHLPAALDRISVLLPTRQWGELMWASIGARPWQGRAALALAAYAVVFALGGAWAYRRDEGERFT